MLRKRSERFFLGCKKRIPSSLQISSLVFPLRRRTEHAEARSPQREQRGLLPMLLPREIHFLTLQQLSQPFISEYFPSLCSFLSVFYLQVLCPCVRAASAWSANSIQGSWHSPSLLCEDFQLQTHNFFLISDVLRSARAGFQPVDTSFCRSSA